MLAALLRGRLFAARVPQTARKFHYNHVQDYWLRKDYFGYREPPFRPYDGVDSALERIFGAFLWWYLIYHFVYHSDLIYGHFPYHKPQTEWTDAELGVPADSEGLAPVIEKVRSIEIPGCSPHQELLPPLFLQMHYGDTGIWKF